MVFEVVQYRISLSKSILSIKALLFYVGLLPSTKKSSSRTLYGGMLWIQHVYASIFISQKKIGDLEEQIRKAQIRVLEQKKKMGGVNASKENDAMIGKQIRTLESRLDKALVRFNEALAENKTMREKIDHLRVDRVVFDNVYKRLERSLHEKKKEMIAIIEDSKVRSFDKR